MNEMSRELDIPYQTLRWRMLNLKELGLSVLPIVDVEKLGLEKVRVFFELTADTDNVKPLFGGLHQSAGLRSYARSMYNQIFDCEFAIPRESFGELSKLLDKLTELKIVRDAKAYRLHWRDVLMLKTEFYDYNRNEWDIDFSKLTSDPSIQMPERNAPVDFDYTDLLMIKDLELDPWIKTVDLASKHDLNVVTASYHINNHVFEKKLIKSFRLRWIGSKEAWLKHSIIYKTFVFNGISPETSRHAMSVFTSLPFTWAHMLADDSSYIAEVTLPVSQYSEATQYISSKLRKIGLTPSEVLEKDWSCLSTYTIPYMMYNKDSFSWDLNSERALQYILQMIESYST